MGIYAPRRRRRDDAAHRYDVSSRRNYRTLLSVAVRIDETHTHEFALRLRNFPTARTACRETDWLSNTFAIIAAINISLMKFIIKITFSFLACAVDILEYDI